MDAMRFKDGDRVVARYPIRLRDQHGVIVKNVNREFYSVQYDCGECTIGQTDRDLTLEVVKHG